MTVNVYGFERWLTYLLTYVFTAKLSIARILLVACLVAKFV